MTVCRLPTGSGRTPLHLGLYFASENMCQNKRSIVKVNNTKDSMCMARAIVVENAMLTKMVRRRGKKTGIASYNQETDEHKVSFCAKRL